MSLGEAAEYVSRAECRVAVDVRRGVWPLLKGPKHDPIDQVEGEFFLHKADTYG